MNSCPRCKSAKLMEGVVPGAEGQPIDGFQPKETRLLQKLFMMPRVRLLDSSQFRACADCGLVWSSVDPSELKDFVQKHGSTKLKEAIK
jgi:hypothetical protein